MPVYHISLRCSSFTNDAQGAFHTFIRVDKPEQSLESYVQQAAHRAMIVGYGGPHQVLAIRRLDARGWRAIEYGAVQRTAGDEARRIHMLDIIERSVVSDHPGDEEPSPAHERDTGDARLKRLRPAYRRRRARPR